MAHYQPTAIQLHLVTGHKLMFVQEDSALVAAICNDLDGNVFKRASLIVNGEDDVTSVPGSALIGITILTDPLPQSFVDREAVAQTVITQISKETFQFKRLRHMANVEGERSSTFSELEFVSGEHLFLQNSEIAESSMGQRNSLHHLFTRPSLWCRRLDGGFSVWNTAHIVYWSQYPKVDVPANSWPAESVPQLIHAEAKLVNVL